MSDEPTSQVPYPPGTFRVGSIAGIPVLVRSSWFLVAALLAWIVAPAVESVQPGLGVWKYVVGVAYAVLFYLTILLHEASHALMARHFGIPVSWIMLHFLGGQTDIDTEPRTAGQEFKIAVVGPLTSIAVGLVSLFATRFAGEGVLHLAVWGVAVANLVLGVLNLVPGLPLDGGRVLRAGVWQLSGDPHRGTVVAAWGGRIAALLVLLWPVVMRYGYDTDPGLMNYLFTFLAALFLWQGASLSLMSAKVRRRLPALKARPLARRAVGVPADLPVAEAVRRAQQAGAGAILTYASDDRVSG
ncbi:MAG: site-2 protease family protein, partial [Myxococcales bacterium]